MIRKWKYCLTIHPLGTRRITRARLALSIPGGDTEKPPAEAIETFFPLVYIYTAKGKIYGSCTCISGNVADKPIPVSESNAPRK